MRQKLELLLIVILLAVFASCNQSKEEKTDNAGPGTLAKTVDLIIKNDDGVWRVLNATDLSKKPPKLKWNDKISWTAEGTDAYIQFPDTLLIPDYNGDNLLNGYTAHLRPGIEYKLKLKVKDSVATGTYVYAVFCMADSVYAQGDSPPKFIIE